MERRELLQSINDDRRGGQAGTWGDGNGSGHMVVPGEFAMGQNGKIKLSSVLDQGDDSEVKPLSIEALRDLLDDWKEAENDGEEPDEDEEGTGEQITALAFRIQTGATPYADFGVWRPHAADLRRTLKFFGYFIGPEGEYFKKELAGPASFEEWLCAWRVYCFVMEVLGQANRVRLRRYSDTIKKLDVDYPGLWWIIALADIKMRKAHMERIRRAVAKKHAERVEAGLSSDFDPRRPWDVVFREAARNTDYWNREVDKKVVQFTTSQRSRAQLVEPGYGPIRLEGQQHGGGDGQQQKKGGGGAGGDDKKLLNKTSQKNRLKKAAAGARAASAAAAAAWVPPPPAAGRGKGKGKGNKGQKGNGNGNDSKDMNGDFFRTADGVQICWAWNKKPDGCTTPCPNERAHVCKTCRLAHRGCAHQG